MKTRLLAFILIELGLLALGYSYFTFISNLIWSSLLGVVAFASSNPAFGTLEKPLGLSGIQFTTTGSHFTPAVIGVTTLVVGLVLLAATLRRSWIGRAHTQQRATINNPQSSQ